LGDAFVLVEFVERVGELLETGGVFEERRDVFKLDARLGKVGDVSQMLKEELSVHNVLSLKVVSAFCFTWNANGGERPAGGALGVLL
jgi:hypothetical protein